jgi:uncharacterized phage infection (PIP) family protein YhgE
MSYHSQYRWVPKQDKSNGTAVAASSYVASHREHTDTYHAKQNKEDRQHELIQTLLENYISMVQKQEHLHEQIQMLQTQVLHLSNCLSWAWNTHPTTTSSTDESVTDWVTLESETPPTHYHSI